MMLIGDLKKLTQLCEHLQSGINQAVISGGFFDILGNQLSFHDIA